MLSFDFVDLPQTVQEYADLEAMMGSILRRWSSGAYQEGELASVDKDGRALAAIYRTEDAYGTQDLVSLIRDLDEGSELAYGRAIFLMRTRLYPDAVPSLARLLLEGSRRGRVSAAELLGAIGDVAAIPALRRSAERDPDDGIRAYSHRSLRKLDIMESRP